MGGEIPVRDLAVSFLDIVPVSSPALLSESPATLDVCPKRLVPGWSGPVWSSTSSVVVTFGAVSTCIVGLPVLAILLDSSVKVLPRDPVEKGDMDLSEAALWK